MASNPARVDYTDEKQKINHIEDAATTSITSDLELRPELTLHGVDMNNTKALKGDDSDGKVEWNTRSIFAAIFLAALYTGLLLPTPSSSCQLSRARVSGANTKTRFSNHSVLCWRVSQLHRRGSWSCSRDSMAAHGQYSCHRRSLSVCGIPAGFVW